VREELGSRHPPMIRVKWDGGKSELSPTLCPLCYKTPLRTNEDSGPSRK
jgi:hypothetical protein